MENIKFIKTITDYVNREREIIGDCVYFKLKNANTVKVWCYNLGVEAKVINKFEGEVDRVKFPFANYFEKTQCSVGAPKWTQQIENGKWWFSEMYSHVLPREKDYKNIAQALDTYIEMYE